MARAGVSQTVVEVLGSFPGSVQVSQYVVEVLLPTDTFSPTTVTGAGVSQYVVEVLGSFAGRARVSQYVVEVLLTEQDAPESGGTITPGLTYVFGYAG